MPSIYTQQWREIKLAMDAGRSVPLDTLENMIRAAQQDLLPPGARPLMALSRPRLSADGKNVVWDLTCLTAGKTAGKTVTVEIPADDIYAMADEDARVWEGADPDPEQFERRGVHPLTPICFASVTESRGGKVEPWRPRLFGNAWPEPEAKMDQDLDGYLWLDSDEEIERNLEHDRDQLICGNTGSGKTTTAINQALKWFRAGGGLVWLNLTDPLDRDESLIFTLLSMAWADKVLVVIDNVHANVSEARGIFDLVLDLRNRFDMPLRVLATGSHAAAHVEAPLSSTALNRVILKGHDLVLEILSGDDSLPPDDKREIRRQADDDAALAKIAIDVWRRYQRIPQGPEFADLVAGLSNWGQISQGGRQFLYKLACLSLFEIELGGQHVVSSERAALQELRARNLVFVNSDSYTIGARSVGRLFVQYALREWAKSDRLPPPDRVVYDFLQRAGTDQIKATLDMLDRDTLTFSTPTYKNLPGAWGSLRFLADSLAGQVRNDPTWQDSVTSAAFACMALIDMDRPDAWKSSAEFVRNRWSLDSADGLPLWVGQPSKDLGAFQRMRDRINEERERVSAEAKSEVGPSERLDCEKACRMWMLGVLLSLEAKAPDRDPDRLDRLVSMAEQQISTREFYPTYAPWVTAQLVLGLCLANHNADEAVEMACRWLCQDRRLGGPYNNGWQNSPTSQTADVICTALCLSALLHAGYPTNEAIETGYRSLCSQQEDLQPPSGKETELAAIIEARLRKRDEWGMRDEWDRLGEVIVALLQWATQGNAVIDQSVMATRPGDPLSACAKTPFIAVQLWIIIWTTVKRELRRLLQERSGLSDLSVNGRSADMAYASEFQSMVVQTVALDLENEQQVRRRVKRAIGRLRGEIEGNINDRARQMPELRGSAREIFARELGKWRERSRELDDIESAFDADEPVSNATIGRINQLGNEIFRGTWEGLPRRQDAE